MRQSDLTDRVNDLMDIARAGEMRCTGTASLVASPAIKARLLLAAAEHRAEAERLHRLVVELRGTPHAGDTDALLADPLWWTPPDPSLDAAALLALCRAEQQREIDRLQELLALDPLPAPVRPVIAEVAEAAAARHTRLDSTVQGSAGDLPMPSSTAHAARSPW